MGCENVNHSNLSGNWAGIPKTEIVENIIREAIRVKFGVAYEELVLDSWSIVFIDTANLIMRANSPFHCKVIRSRLLADMEQVIADVYEIHPVILITSDQ